MGSNLKLCIFTGHWKIVKQYCKIQSVNDRLGNLAVCLLVGDWLLFWVLHYTRDMKWLYLAQFCADKNHTKISCEYSAIKRWLRCRDILRIQKIRDARTIKNCWLRTKTSAICADKNHIKISDEYVIKKRYLRTKTGTRDVRVSREYNTTIKRWWNMISDSCLKIIWYENHHLMVYFDLTRA